MAEETSDILSSLDARTFIQEGGPFGNVAAEYLGCARIGGVTIPLGDREVIWCPSPDQYRAYVPVDRKVSRPGTPTTELMAYMRRKGVDRQARMAREHCPFVLYQNFGQCTRPDDFDSFEKTIVIEGAEFTELAYADLGVLDGDGEPIIITTPVSFGDAYQVVPITFAERAAAEVTVRVVDVTVCDAQSCGECDDPSNGCEDIYAVTTGLGGSPGNNPELIYSTDGGTTWNDDSVTTYTGAEGANAIACAGGDTLIIASMLGTSHSWAAKSSPTVWTEVSTGYVFGKGPKSLWVRSEREVWFAAQGGYVYKSTDYTASVTAVETGGLSTQDLNKVHGFGETIVVVGNSNVVLYSSNGGVTFTLLTGPAVGVNLNTVWVKSHKEWWIGTAGGQLFYTLDRGATWTEKTFSGSGAGTVNDIAFVTPTVGYMAHATATPVARLFRTKDGGNTWKNTTTYVGSYPVADRFEAIAICQDPNFVVVAGLGDNATDGIVAVGS